VSKVWFITGTSKGFGRIWAEAALERGDKVAATARNAGTLDDLTERYGDAVLPLALDVTDKAAIDAAVAKAHERFGRLDVVVNNAGYANINSIEDIAHDDFHAQIDTNFFGVVNVTRAALPVLRTQRDGHVIQISSIGGRTATPGLAAYQSAKFAVEGFSEALSNEVGPLGIRVTIVEPGGMRTDWAGSSMHIDDIRDDYKATVGAFVQMALGNADAAQSDPAKAAQAILEIASTKEPPLRLLLGSDAVFLAGVVAAARAAEDARWKPLSLSTDYEGLVDFAETPVAKMLTATRS
jgi:NAD(P)-dependent dehydrogenase (short-subunit alcohol dehydrogenase family)